MVDNNEAEDGADVNEAARFAASFHGHGTGELHSPNLLALLSMKQQ